MKRSVIIVLIALSIGANAQDFSKLNSLYASGKIEKCITKSKKYKTKNPNSPEPYYYDFKCYVIKLTGSYTPITYRDNLALALSSAYSYVSLSGDIPISEDLKADIAIIIGLADSEIIKLEEEGKTDRKQMFEELTASLSSFEQFNPYNQLQDATIADEELVISPNSDVTNTSSDQRPPNETLEQLTDISESLVGVPYRYGGRDKSGFDCSGFTSYVFGACAMSLPRTSAAQSQIGESVAIEDVRKGDLLFFGTNKKISHVAMVISQKNQPLRVVHSTSSKGVIIHSETDSDWVYYWSKRLQFARRVVSE